MSLTQKQQQMQRQQLLQVQKHIGDAKVARAFLDVLLAPYQYTNPNINVFHDPKKGRGLKAAKKIPAGTVLVADPSANRVDLVDGMEHRAGNIHLGLWMYSRLSLYGFQLDNLAIPNDTLGSESDQSQPEFITGDCVGTRGVNAQQEYPLSDVAPILPEYMCPNLSQLPNYPNPLLYQDDKGEIQHIPLNVPKSLPAELRTNLINAMQDRTKGYQLLLRSILMAQENSVMTPYNTPFLLPHHTIKPKAMTQQEVDKAKKDGAKKAKEAKTTQKILSMKKNGAPAKKAEEKKEEEKPQPPQRITYNYFKQIMEDNELTENLPASMLHSCRQLEDDDDDDDEEEEDEEDEEEVTPSKGGKNNNKKAQQEEEEEEDAMEPADQLVLFPTFALLNHDCSPNTTPMFYHLPTHEYLTQVYKEHKELVAKQAAEIAASGSDRKITPTTFNLPREASFASLAVVVALRDIEAGEELTINYTPLAHCEASASLSNNSPVIQYIPWMQEFRKSQMKRVHHMVCTCKTCQVDGLIQRACGAELLVDDNVEKPTAKTAEEQEEEDKKKAEEEAKKNAQEVKPLEPLLTFEPEIAEELKAVEATELAKRILLHTVVIDDKQSTYNRNAVPLMMFRNRMDGNDNPNPTVQHPEDIIQRLQDLSTHPLWTAFFAPRGGMDKITPDTELLKVSELFNASTSLLNSIAWAINAGRADPSAAEAVGDEAVLQQNNIMPVIVPKAFNAVSTVLTDAAVPIAIISSDKATLIPTVSQLDSTTALATSIGIYAAVSGGFERMQTQGLPEMPEPEPVDTTPAEIADEDLFSDETNFAAAGTANKEKIAELKAKKKTAAIVNATDGSVVKNNDKLRKELQEMRAYREMAHILEAIVMEVLGVNESDGRKEYLLPTHWFISSCLGLLHAIYLKLGGVTESLFAAMFLTYITGISVPLSDIDEVEMKLKHHTPTEMRDLKKITEKWTYIESAAPAPGHTVKPMHQTLLSLMVYLSDSLDQLLPQLELCVQYCRYQLERVSAEEYAPKDGEEPIDKEDMLKKTEFINTIYKAVFFLGRSLEKYMW